MAVVRMLVGAVAVLAAGLVQAQPVAEPPPSEPPPSVPAPVPPAAAPAPPREAAAPADRGAFTFGVRGAWLKPHGIVAGLVGSDNQVPMSKEFGTGTQLTLEGGYRFPVGLTLGAFLQAGFVSPESTAGNGLCGTVTCDTGRTYKYGVELLYHFRRDRPLQPFLGAGFGWERSGYDAHDATDRVTFRYKGVQYLDAQLGLDYAVAPRLFLGAFVANSFGRYDTLEASGAITVSGDIAEKKTHSWLQVGVRLRYDVPL